MERNKVAIISDAIKPLRCSSVITSAQQQQLIEGTKSDFFITTARSLDVNLNKLEVMSTENQVNFHPTELETIFWIFNGS